MFTASTSTPYGTPTERPVCCAECQTELPDGDEQFIIDRTPGVFCEDCFDSRKRFRYEMLNYRGDVVGFIDACPDTILFDGFPIGPNPAKEYRGNCYTMRLTETTHG